MMPLRHVDYITPGRTYAEDDPPSAGLVSYADQVNAGIVRRNGPSFVAADPKPIVRRVDVAPVQPHEVAPVMPSQTVQELRTSHVDRAKGFSIATVPLAAVVGTVALLGAVTLAGVPLLSGVALLILFGVFGAVWLAAWVWYQSASPDGIGLWQVLLHYRLLRYEQRARHERMRKELDR